MTKLYGINDVVSKLDDEDITHKWVIVSPEFIKKEWQAKYHTKRSQVVLATSGFGCKGTSLSLMGGKVYSNDVNGKNCTIHRRFILGIASPTVLQELGIDK